MTEEYTKFRNKKEYLPGDPILVSTFPAAGGVNIEALFHDIFLNMESTIFEQVADMHPLYKNLFPLNYVNAIEIVMTDSRSYRFIFISHHPEVMEELHKRGIKFIFIHNLEDDIVKWMKEDKYPKEMIDSVSKQYNASIKAAAKYASKTILTGLKMAPLFLGRKEDVLSYKELINDLNGG